MSARGDQSTNFDLPTICEWSYGVFNYTLAMLWEFAKKATSLIAREGNGVSEPKATEAKTETPEVFESLNQWLLSLPAERKAILREDKWMLAEAAFAADAPSAVRK